MQLTALLGAFKVAVELSQRKIWFDFFSSFYSLVFLIFKPMARDVLCMLQCKYTYKVIRHPFHFFLWFFLYVPRASKLNHPITAFLGILSWVPSVTLSFNIDRRLFQKSTVTCFQSFGKLCSSADGDVKKSKSDAHIDMLRNYLLLLAVASSCNNEHSSKKKTERKKKTSVRTWSISSSIHSSYWLTINT